MLAGAEWRGSRGGGRREMATSAESGPCVGRRIKRVEDPRLLAGQGRFVDDVALPGLLHLVVVRSTHAHARLGRAAGTKALGPPGVAPRPTGPEGERLVEPLPVNTRVPGQRLLDAHAMAVHKVL